MVANIRAAEAAVGRRLPILMDIAGPKVRTGAISTPAKGTRLMAGDAFLLCREIGPPAEGVAIQITCSMPDVLDRVAIGDAVSLDDGKLQGRIVGESPRGFVVRMERGSLDGVKLKPGKGLNFPATDLMLDPLTGEGPARSRLHRRPCRHDRAFLRPDRRERRRPPGRTRAKRRRTGDA